jgi:hypothetical protein
VIIFIRRNDFFDVLRHTSTGVRAIVDTQFIANSRESGKRGTRLSLVHYVKPFLELDICKEYCMATKTTGNTTTKRSKKADLPVSPAAVQAAPEVRKEARKNGKPANLGPVNLEEEIRRRAYELYLQRRATAGIENGDENQDWLLAEREVLSLHGGQRHHMA